MVGKIVGWRLKASALAAQLQRIFGSRISAPSDRSRRILRYVVGPKIIPTSSGFLCLVLIATALVGTYAAVLIRWDYAGETGPADIKDSQHRFIASGAGMVAMVQIRSISAMLIYNDHTKRGKILERVQ